MFTTPLRSEKMPPIAANVSGVAARSVAAMSVDHTNGLLERRDLRPRREPAEQDAEGGRSQQRPSARRRLHAEAPRPQTESDTDAADDERNER